MLRGPVSVANPGMTFRLAGLEQGKKERQHERRPVLGGGEGQPSKQEINKV